MERFANSDSSHHYHHLYRNCQRHMGLYIPILRLYDGILQTYGFKSKKDESERRKKTEYMRVGFRNLNYFVNYSFIYSISG